MSEELIFRQALEALAEALQRCAIVFEKRYAQEYPDKPNVRDARITHPPTSEERAKSRLSGDTSQSIEEWTAGPCEREFDEREKNTAEAKPASPGRKTPPAKE
jgi:hypothetical protein